LTVLWAGELHYLLVAGFSCLYNFFKAGGLPWLYREYIANFVAMKSSFFGVSFQTRSPDNCQVHRRCRRCQYEALYRLDAGFASVGLFILHLRQLFISFPITRYIALFAWTIAVWVSYNVLIDARQRGNASPRATHVVDLIGKLLFSIFICAAILLFEKFAIQWIAGKFHERSYAGTQFFFFFFFGLDKFFHQSVSPIKNSP